MSAILAVILERALTRREADAMTGCSKAAWLCKTIAAAGLLGVLAGCNQDDPDRVQGYVEGEFVYVAAPSAGAMQSLVRAPRPTGASGRSAVRPGPRAGKDCARRGPAQAGDGAG